MQPSPPPTPGTFSFQIETLSPSISTSPSPLPSSLWQSVFYLVSPWICQFEVFHICEITQYLSFCDWFISLTMVSRFIPGCSTYQNFLPFCGWVVFHSMHVPHCVYPSIYLLMVNWVVSIFWLLWAVLMWTLRYKYLFESLPSISFWVCCVT